MKPLTPRQREVLDWIRGYIAANSYPPTIREIGRQFGIRSTNAVTDHLRLIEKKGFITRDGSGTTVGSKSRSMRLLDAPRGDAPLTQAERAELLRKREALVLALAQVDELLARVDDLNADGVLP